MRGLLSGENLVLISLGLKSIGFQSLQLFGLPSSFSKTLISSNERGGDNLLHPESFGSKMVGMDGTATSESLFPLGANDFLQNSLAFERF